MSFRDLPTTKDGLTKLLRDVMDRLERLEKGSGTAGVVSFGTVIQVGDVQISVVTVAGPGNHRNLVATNVRNGQTSTLATL